MRKRLAPTVLAAALLAPAAIGHAASQDEEGLFQDGFVSNFDILMTAKVMDSDWDIDGNSTNLFGYAAGYSVRPIEWPIGLQIAYTNMDNENSSNADLYSKDLQVGLFYLWGEGSGLRFEAGGGMAWSEVEIDVPDSGTPGEIDSITERAVGVYGRGAIRYGFTEWLDIVGSASMAYQPHDRGSETVNLGGILFTAGGSIRF